MRKLILPFLVLCATALQAQLNIQFRSNLSYGALTLANIGGYVDSLGNEYALVGYQSGLDIVDVTNPANPVVKFTVPGNNSEWREVKTYRKYAYVTTEQYTNGATCCNGLQIVDLSRLPASINSKAYIGDGAINGQIRTIHALHIDTAKAFCYLYGSNISTGANNNGYPLILSLTDPWNPVYTGHFITPTGDAYVHDGYVQNDTAYFCHIYDGYVSIVDETNKSAPVLLARQLTPGAFTHNSWLSDNHHVMFTTDEISNSYLTAYDISNLSNITELSRFQTDPGSNAIVHNTHILNDYAVTSWYTQGVVIVDESRPDNPVEVGHYDTYPASNGNGFYGDWGVYPFLPSGNLVCSDINNGLFVLSPTYVRGCYLEGIVTDSVTTLAIQGASVQVLTTALAKTSDIAGSYKMGTVTPGTFSVQVSKAGYVTKTITGVTLTNGVLTTLNVQLVRLAIKPVANFVASATSSCTGVIQFTDSSANLPTSWYWAFGDGGTSTLQNPSHTYSSNNSYTVMLVVTNAYGTDTLTLSNFITVNLPPSPVTTSATVCSGNAATLLASGSSVISWFNNQFGGSAIDTGTTFMTPVLNSTTTYYVESDVYPAPLHDGPINHSFGSGGYFTATNYHDLVFDVYAPITLASVYVYAGAAGQRTIMLDSSGVTINSVTVNIPNGGSRVILNFPIYPGTNYELGCQGNVDLYRNNSGSAYPYTLNGLVSITGDNSGSTGYYYYFYDWMVIGPPCISARVPVTATVDVPSAAFTSTIVGNIGSFADSITSGGNTYQWNFGDPASGANNTSVLGNPTHIFSSLGTYQVCLTVTDLNGCSTTVCKPVVITSSNIIIIDPRQPVSVYPNPFSKEITIEVPPNATGVMHLKISDMLGKILIETSTEMAGKSGFLKWDLSSIAAGAYILTFENNGFSQTKKLVKIN